MISKKKSLTTTQMIILSFLLAIGVGTILLMLPVASADGCMTPFIDALFTTTTSVCVTGLVTLTTATHWSLFGHIVILCLIQIGGVGVITITTTILVAVGKKISLSSRMLLGDSFNLDTLQGLVVFLKKVFKGTFLVEGVGAICYMPVFVPEYGVWRGLWYSVFHAVSAFCNAGIDILGDTSFCPYVHNVWMNLVTMSLIILGGLGFIVWWDVISVLKRQPCKKHILILRQLSVHSKIVLTMTIALLTIGTILFFVFEYTNPQTIGNFTFGEKVLAAMFQSVTTRTAGIATISQAELTTPSVITCVVLMFIGGSSVGTAGGIKVTTLAVVLLSVWATVQGRDDACCFGRRISDKVVRKSYAIILISFFVSVVALILLCLLESGEVVDLIFEVYSAIGTVGLTRNYTPLLSTAGKSVLILCMYLGRVGPISMVFAFAMKDKQSSARLPEGKITVG